MLREAVVQAAKEGGSIFRTRPKTAPLGPFWQSFGEAIASHPDVRSAAVADDPESG